MLFVLLILSLPIVSFGQNEDVIDGLTATEFNGKVLVTWSVTQGNTCLGIKILHSLDSTNFTQVGSIEGICGSTAETISYEFTHLSPEKNAVNYYRIHLGGVGYSWIVNAEVLDLAETNYILRPNPVIHTSELLFDNPTNATYELKIYRGDGVVLHSEDTSGELFIVNGENFQPGYYLFSISKRGELPNISGKLQVF